MTINCIVCDTSLKGGIDTFGDWDAPMCMECHFDLLRDEMDDMYGPGPHIHNLSKTGSYIGSTELLELPKPDASGWIDLEPLGGWYVNWMYREDTEAPGCGVYVHKQHWRNECSQHQQTLLK